VPAMVTVAANKILDATLGTATLTAFSGAAKIRLTTTAPTASAAGTELTGTGYTTGGSTIVFGAASANAATGPASQLQWTNGSGGSWSIVGLEIWDSAGTPLRWWFGLWTGQPIVIANGNIFQINANGITVGQT
jgi:hypothetical protein